MLWYFDNVFAMLEVALIAKAFFRDDWHAGIFAGIFAIGLGAWFHGSSLPTRGNN